MDGNGDASVCENGDASVCENVGGNGDVSVCENVDGNGDVSVCENEDFIIFISQSSLSYNIKHGMMAVGHSSTVHH